MGMKPERATFGEGRSPLDKARQSVYTPSTHAHIPSDLLVNSFMNFQTLTIYVTVFVL